MDQDDEEGADQVEEDMISVGSEEDPNVKEPGFKEWLSWSSAHISMFRCLLKLADKIDTAGDENDDEDGAFEDIEINDV